MMNAPKAFHVFFNMMRPLQNERVKQSIIFHDSLESLYEFVDKEILPEELGGTSGEFDSSATAIAVLKMNEYFEQLKDYAENINN